MIRRTTRGGELRLEEPPAGAIVTCSTCGHIPAREAEQPIMLGVQTTHPETREPITLDTSICGDCLAEALAILFGRRHAQRGGDVEDLADASRSSSGPGDASPVDARPLRPTIPACCAAAFHHNVPCPTHGPQ